MIQPTNMQMPMQYPQMPMQYMQTPMQYPQMPMQQPQQGNGANAVAINIYNPQAYGSTPQANNMQAPYQLPYSFYQMPVASTYNQAMPPQAYQQFMPIQNPIMQQPQALVAPAPQLMPESVMAQAPAIEAQPQQMQAVEAQAAPVAAEPQAAQAVENVEVQQPQNNIPIINTD